jgi:hypothetical protein
MTTPNTEDRRAMTDAIYAIACGAGPTVDNEMAIRALVEVLAVLVAAGTSKKPAGNINLVASAIGQEIADEARRFRGNHKEEVH